MAEKEKEKEIQDITKRNNKKMAKFEYRDLEKQVENHMKFNVPKSQKTSLVDPLDILKKEPSVIPIEKQIEKYKTKSKDNNTINEIKIKKYDSGLEINYTLDKYGQAEIISINEESVDDKSFKNLESDFQENLDFYIKKIYSKFNYSPIIKKFFGKKLTFEEIEHLSIMWRFYVELKIKDDEKAILDFREKLLKTLTDNVKLLIKNIFSIMKIREAMHTLPPCYQTYSFLRYKEYEKKDKGNVYDMRVIYLDPYKETTGNGVSFILIKEFNRSLNMLLYSSKYLFYSFAPIFNNDFNFLYMILRKIYFVFFHQNFFFSTLLFNIKGIFYRSDMKEVSNEIDNLTIPFELDFEKGNAKKEVMDIEFDNPKELLFDFNSCFDQLGYSVDVNDEKGEEVIIETEEEKKVKEIKDIDELVKYIEGDTKTKKKKKKKKKKEDPIDILLKLKEQNKELDDETASQCSLSYISQDGAFNDFRKDIKKETKDNKFEKIKPQFSKEFVSNFK